uniref:UDP-glucuronosyltransferase n=1 Tax=Adineta vaga TaxID=104782 RepID=B3G458_ADIVA|nr:UDP-glucosyl transferase-like protein [Adineta vaga]
MSDILRWIMLSSEILLCTTIFVVCSMTDRNTGHIVLITSPFYGHIIPMIDLAKRLAVHHYVTYIVSVSKLDMLKHRGFIDENETNDLNDSRLEIIGLYDGNNDDYEATNPDTINHIPLILDRMHEPLLQLLFPVSTTSPSSRLIRHPIDLIISDLFIVSPVFEGSKRGIMTYFFVPNNLRAHMNYINLSLKKIQNDESGIDFDRSLHKAMSFVKGLVCNSIRELDRQSLQDLRQQTVPGSDKPIFFIAPLMPEDHLDEKYRDASVKQWLDTQWKKTNGIPSVIYISFGSWAYLKPKQLEEIIRALKQYPFIWSLKANLQATISSSSIHKDKHILLQWAPQRSILSHPAIRLFISHGGWNSLLEGMLAGKPILVWPLFGDQIINGLRLEVEFEMGRCIRYADLSSGQRLVSSDELTQYLKEIFNQEMIYVRNAQYIRQIMMHAKEKSSRKDFEKIIKIVNNRIATQPTKHTDL